MTASPSELARRTQQAFAGAFMEMEPDLTIPQAVVLRLLVTVGPLNQTNIVKLSGIDRSTIGEMLPRMAEHGFVKSERDLRDMRAKIVNVTRAGKKALIRADRALIKAEEKIMRMVPDALRKPFLDAMRAIGKQ